MSQNKNNISTLGLKRMISLSYLTAWRMQHNLMQVMSERESTTKLSGRVEFYDAYFGGELSGGKVGRGSKNKAPFIAAVQTSNQNKPCMLFSQRVKAFNSQEILAWVSQSLVPDTNVVSDGSGVFSPFLSLGSPTNVKLLVKGEKVRTWNALPGSIRSLAI